MRPGLRLSKKLPPCRKLRNIHLGDLVFARKSCVNQLNVSDLSSVVRSASRRNGFILQGTTTPLLEMAYSTAPETRKDCVTAYVAIGSNIGNRLANLEMACAELSKHDSIKLIKTSSLYLTEAMYVVDQDQFFNAVCEISTTLEPLDLLDALQNIENQLGRVKLIDKGPRNIDLDILSYGNEMLDTPRLTIPHKLMHEREFVLRPLADIAPNVTVPSLNPEKTISTYLKSLFSVPLSSTSPSSSPPMNAIVPFHRDSFLSPDLITRRTKVMSILNVTPDSFSDGGQYYQDSTIYQILDTVETKKSDEICSLKEKVLSHKYYKHIHDTIKQHVLAGANVLDIGGQSSRPGAISITAEEEYQRIKPALIIQALFFPNLPISIDTYRSKVIQSILDDKLVKDFIINDISAGQMDSNMLTVAAQSQCTIILMHMRGTPLTMTSPKNTSYPDGIIETVGSELFQRVQEAQAAGIHRWRIILDPGIGFAKTAAQNLQLLRDFAKLKAYPGLQGLPWVIGSSRKKTIGTILGGKDELVKSQASKFEGRLEQEMVHGEDASKDRLKDRSPISRDYGTAATVAAAIQGGADMVRVHNTKDMADVVAMSDAIWRGIEVSPLDLR